MNIKIIKTNNKNNDFVKLARLLDADLETRYGALQKQYEEHNKADYIKDVLLIYKENIAVACGAFKEYDTESVELKRIFVVEEQRHQGIAKLLIQKLEESAKSKGYKYAVLETGIKQLEAINLYKDIGYTIIQNYGPYIGNINSICMKKAI
jgi:GNAT superfamily N-acetyltransferase